MTTLSSKHPVLTILNGMVGILDYVTKLPIKNVNR